MSELQAVVTDYHMHSTFSPDGHVPPEALCRQALAVGLTEIAITEHAEWRPGWAPGLPRAAEFMAAIEQCRATFGPQGLRVLAGVEVGNPHEHPDEVHALLAAHPFDVVLGSLHWLHGENIHHEACFAGRCADDLYADYFTEMGRMVGRADIDVVAHFDRIFWRGTLLGFPCDPQRCEPIVRGALAAIVRQNVALELNTKFLALEPGWSAALVVVLRWFREMGGSRVVLGSDAHCPEMIGRNLARGAELLRAAGFEAPARLAARRGRLSPAA